MTSVQAQEVEPDPTSQAAQVDWQAIMATTGMTAEETADIIRTWVPGLTPDEVDVFVAPAHS